MERRKFGNTNLEVSAISLGCWIVGVDWWGSKRHRGDGVTHWCPFPKPPGAGEMYDYVTSEDIRPEAWPDSIRQKAAQAVRDCLDRDQAEGFIARWHGHHVGRGVEDG